MSERPTLLDALVDLAVYAPVGLALTAAEELPELIAKGRARVDPQLGTARLVGQFVVAEGRRRVVKFSGFGGAGASSRPGDPAKREDGRAAASGSSSGDSPSGSSSGAGGAATAEAPTSAHEGAIPDPGETRSSKAAKRPAPGRRASGSDGPVPEVGSLAIPGYDSLSASQVVQRLAGLSPSELSAVGRYEAATRGRRTILARVSQLQGS